MEFKKQIIIVVLLFLITVIIYNNGFNKFYLNIFQENPNQTLGKKDDPIFEQKCFTKNKHWQFFKEKVLKNNAIFDTVEVNNGLVDLQGWGNLERFIEKILEKAMNYSTDSAFRVIEVGSWKGRSTTIIAQTCLKLEAKYKKQCSIIAIDSWLGSSEHYEVDLPKNKKNIFMNDLFTIFLNNVKYKKLHGVIFPVRLPSNVASHVLHCYQIDADVIFLDADHDYKPVARDIETFYPLVKKNGMLFGHDYNWDGVRKAVDEFRFIKDDKVAFNLISAFGTYWFMEKLSDDTSFFEMS